jgi:hypothetical protein
MIMTTIITIIESYVMEVKFFVIYDMIIRLSVKRTKVTIKLNSYKLNEFINNLFKFFDSLYQL